MTYMYSGEGGEIDTAPIEKSIADLRRAGAFRPLPVLELHQIADGEDFAPQRVKRGRVKRKSEATTIAVAVGHRKASIAVTRGSRIVARGRWGCGRGSRDQAAIVGAVIIGAEVYAEVSCTFDTRWLRVPPVE